MDQILNDFLKSVLSQFLDKFFALFYDLGDSAFYIENNLSSIGGTAGFQNILTVTTVFATSFALVLLLKKGWYVYVLWRDGDASESPATYLQNFGYALVVILSFPTLYGWLVDIIKGIANSIGQAIYMSSTNLSVPIDSVLDALIVGSQSSTTGMIWTVFLLIFAVLWIVLYFKFLTVGIELFLLRLGTPIAAVGLINNDGGIFKDYVITLAESVITVSLQIILANISIALVVSTEAIHLVYAIAFAAMAIKTPQFLQKFLISRRGGGGTLGHVYHAAQLFKSFKK